MEGVTSGPQGVGSRSCRDGAASAGWGQPAPPAWPAIFHSHVAEFLPQRALSPDPESTGQTRCLTPCPPVRSSVRSVSHALEGSSAKYPGWPPKTAGNLNRRLVCLEGCHRNSSQWSGGLSRPISQHGGPATKRRVRQWRVHLRVDLTDPGCLGGRPSTRVILVLLLFLVLSATARTRTIASTGTITRSLRWLRPPAAVSNNRVSHRAGRRAFVSRRSTVGRAGSCRAISGRRRGPGWRRPSGRRSRRFAR